MADDTFRGVAEPYALGVLDPGERAEFEAHLTSGCAACQGDVARHESMIAALPRELPARAPDTRLREQVLDLADAPSLPLDLAAYEWADLAPGVKIHVAREDPARGFRAWLVWAKPGARHGLHRHLGDENILVLQGGLKDERGEYRAGDVCRSREGSVHTEEILPGDDCFCYVTYYGDVEMIE